MSNSENTLTAQEREARARYFREWRAKNREKVRIYNQRYWQKKAAQQNSGKISVEGVSPSRKNGQKKQGKSGMILMRKC